MFKNYLTVAWRNIVKNKASSLINIGGLAVGMFVAMLIGLWVYNEFSFNKYFDNYSSIAQVNVNANYDGQVYTISSNPMPLANELRTTYGNNFKYVVMSSGTEQHELSVGDKEFKQGGNYMEADAPSMFTLKMVEGIRAGLKDINSIMLSQSVAKKLFGNDAAINKLIRIDNKIDVKVTGVYEDLPNNTEFKDVSFIAPLELYISSNDWLKNARNSWNNQSVQIYAQVNPGIDVSKVSALIKNVKLNHVTGRQALRKPALFLHSMSQWHLYSRFENGIPVTSEQLKFIWFYTTIGIFVLLLACINFMNLSTARSEKRAKEVGIRKAVGSLRKQLVSQFFAESLLVVALAFMLAVGLVQSCLPWFNTIADKKISIPFTNPLFWFSGIIFIVVTGILAGSYPAFYLSSFNPVKVLKGTFRVGRFASMQRKALVVLQFTVSIVLIIGTIVVYRQIQFAKNRPVGYSRDGLLAFQMAFPDIQTKYNTLKTELKNTGAVTEIAESASPVTSIWSTNKGFSWKGNPAASETTFATLAVTQEYGKTTSWQFVEGRDFSQQLASDSEGFVINESAAQLMGLPKPVGETVGWDNGSSRKNYKVLGVVKDMVMESPFAKASPTIFFMQAGDMNYLLVKINPTISAGDALPKITSVFKKIFPSAVLNYKFVADEYAAKFAAEERVGTLAGFFAVLAVMISCLGLFGLASFVAEQRTKEIGVRKVLGASVFTLWRLLCKDFVVLVMLALLIAGPTAYYFMHGWLQDYAYRTEISWWIFAAAGTGALIITLLTVSYQSIRAALMNPVNSLKTE